VSGCVRQVGSQDGSQDPTGSQPSQPAAAGFRATNCAPHRFGDERELAPSTITPLSVQRGSGFCAWAAIGVLLFAGSGCRGSSNAADADADPVRDELRQLIENVAQSTAHQYQLRDTDGRDMGPTKVIWSPEAQQFVGVYSPWDESVGAFVVHLATSDDLFTWDERRTYSVGGSQPSIARTPSGRYVLAWEQEPDPIHLSLVEFRTWDDLVAEDGTPRFIDLPVAMAGACGEGTPDITSATDDRVDLTFHYHAGCERDLQASGWTDWTEWHATPNPGLDSAMGDAGVVGHIGDRSTFTFRGRPFMLIEGETVPGDWASWRLFLYDPLRGAVEPLDIRTDGGSRAFSNPAVDIVDIKGKPSLLVTMYLFMEGAADGEDGGLIYYQVVPERSDS
jgi:hypothetical protein